MAFYYGAATYLQAHPRGGFVLSGRRALDAADLEEEGYIARLDDRGDILFELTVDQLDSSIVLEDGRVFVLLNPGLTGGEPNPLHVAEVRCESSS